MNDTTQPSRPRNDLPLYGAAFLTSISLTVWWSAMPFLIKGLGGSEVQVGWAFAANMVGYVGLLLATSVVRSGMGPRRATLGSGLVLLACAGATLWAVLAKDLGPGRVWTVIASGAVAGMAMAFFWPFLMSWSSLGYEGQVLNQRLGYYNRSWSSGFVVGPLIGTALVAEGLVRPMCACMAGLAASLVCILMARSVVCQGVSGPASVGQSESVKDKAHGTALLWMARLALFGTWSALTILRSQFPLLMRGMGFSERQFGVVLTVCAVSNFLVLTALGKGAAWHGMPGPLLWTQVATAGAMVLLMACKTLAHFWLAAVVIGCSVAMAYSAHLYYGAIVVTHRSRAMILHELTVALSVIAASVVGGYLAQFGPRAPYGFIGVITLASLAGQVGIWARHRRSRSSD